MRLSVIQATFTVAIAQLINYGSVRGYALTFGDAMRDPRLHGEWGEKKAYGKAFSVHKMRLAVDFNLYIDGLWIADGNHPAWLELGEEWEKIHDLARWGGRFNDANHFSFEYGGYK